MLRYCKRCQSDTERYARGDCKICNNVCKAAWREAHPEERRSRDAAYRKAHPEKYNTSGRASWRKANKEKIKMYWIRKTYGLTSEEYKKLLDDQKGVCYLCHQPETRKRRGALLPLCLDHCHQSGKVRKFLCFRCNTVLGMVEEDPILVENLKTYIVEHSPDA
jgi:hypothetical protein